MPTIKEKLEQVQQQILDGKTAISYALQYAGVTAVVPNDNVPDKYETFESYSDKIRRLQVANSLILEFEIPEGNLTAYKRTVVLPMTGINYNTIAQTIIEADTAYTPTNEILTLSSLDEDFTVEDTSHFIFDHWGNEIVDGNYSEMYDENDEPYPSMDDESGIMPLADDDEPDYAFTVDWGDGTVAQYTTTADTEAIYHTYASAGTYNININGNFRVFRNAYSGSYRIVDGAYYQDKDGTNVYDNTNYAMRNYLTKVIAWGNTRLRDMNSAFYHAEKLSEIPMFDTTNSFADVTTFNQGFRDCYSLKEIPYDSNTQRGLFSGCDKVTSYAYCFYNDTGLTSSIPPKLIESSTLCTTIQGMFAACRNLTGSVPVGIYDNMPNLTNAASSFEGCINMTGDFPSILFPNNPKITSIEYLFLNCSGLTGTISSQFISSLSSLTNMRKAFYNCTGITGITADAFSGITANNINCRMAFYNTGIREIPAGLIESMTGTGIYFEKMFAHCNQLTTVASSVFSAMNNPYNVRGMFDECTGITSALPDAPSNGDWDDADSMRKYYSVFGNCKNMANYDSIPLELGGGGERSFPDRKVGAIVLADKTTVDPKDYSYNESNAPIGIVYTDNGDGNVRFMSLGDTTRKWTDTELLSVDTPLPNLSDWNTAYVWGRYSGQTFTDTILEWSGYTNNPDNYPAHKYISEYSAGTVNQGDWFLGDGTDGWDFWIERGLMKNACDAIIAGGGGFSTSNCYPPRDNTWYWTSAEYNQRYAWYVITSSAYVFYVNKWLSGYVRPVSLT